MVTKKLFLFVVLATLGITFSCTNDVQEEWQSVNSPLKSNV